MVTRARRPIFDAPTRDLCPNCERVTDHDPIARRGHVQVDGLRQAISDVGRRCRACLHDHGFELLTDAAIEGGTAGITEVTRC